LLFQEQGQGCAICTEYADADAMMGDVARAARSVDYLLDYTWHTLEHKGKDGLGRILKRPRVATVAKNVSASNREIVIDPFTSFNEDPVVGLRACGNMLRNLACRSRLIPVLNCQKLQLKGEGVLSNPWPREACELLIALIGAGAGDGRYL
jgi:[protein-PII] uridylyltransferase